MRKAPQAPTTCAWLPGPPSLPRPCPSCPPPPWAPRPHQLGGEASESARASLCPTPEGAPIP
eukprot:1850208-Alexandrium_andersonii.AAC.1